MKQFKYNYKCNKIVENPEEYSEDDLEILEDYQIFKLSVSDKGLYFVDLDVLKVIQNYIGWKSINFETQWESALKICSEDEVIEELVEFCRNYKDQLSIVVSLNFKGTFYFYAYIKSLQALTLRIEDCPAKLINVILQTMDNVKVDIDILKSSQKLINEFNNFPEELKLYFKMFGD